MTQTLFEILTDEELTRLKTIGLHRNVRIKDMTLEEVDLLKKVMWPPEHQHEKVNLMDVIVQLSRRKAL